MPKLAALPRANMPRMKLKYSSLTVQHSITVHGGANLTSADAGANMQALANLLKPLVPSNVVFTGVEYAPQGSDVFNPVLSLNIPGTLAGAAVAVDRPKTLSFTGRSTTGRKTRIMLVGITLIMDPNYRIAPGESSLVDAVVAGLVGDTGAIRCIDGSQPVWHNYANYGVSDHWLRVIRRTG